MPSLIPSQLNEPVIAAAATIVAAAAMCILTCAGLAAMVECYYAAGMRCMTAYVVSR